MDQKTVLVDPYLRYLLFSIFFLVVAGIVQLVYIAHYSPLPLPAQNLVDGLKGKKRIVLFGDSVIDAYGTENCDPGATGGIHDRLDLALGAGSVLAINRAAYSPLVYNDLTDVIIATDLHPSFVVIPINMRSFSEGWYSRPSYGFMLLRALLRARTGHANIMSYIHIWKYSFSRALEHEMAIWRDHDVTYPSYRLGSNHSVNENMKDIPIGLECKPEQKETFRQSLRIGFIYHYMYNLDSNHPVLIALTDMVKKLRQRQIPVIIYMTPINVEDGIRFVGPEFRERVRNNLAVIRASLAQWDTAWFDWLESLPAERFTDQNFVCEHLDEEGRQFVATQLAVAIRARP